MASSRPEPKTIVAPSLVRIKAGALQRIGKYAHDLDCPSIVIFWEESFQSLFGATVQDSLKQFYPSSKVVFETTVKSAAVEDIFAMATSLPSSISLIIGIGGGVALDSAKWAGHFLGKPTMLVPTVLSQDAFASFGVCLDVNGVKRSLIATPPACVVLDLTIIKSAPLNTIYAGVGEIAGKMSSLVDWEIGFQMTEHLPKEKQILPDNLSVTFMKAAWEACIFTPPSEPKENPCLNSDFLVPLANGFLISGLAMNASGTSHSANGSEHLISDAINTVHTAKKSPPLLPGIQIGITSYITSHLQQYANSELKPAPFNTNFASNVHTLTKRFLTNYRFFDFCGKQPETQKLRLSTLLEAIKNAPDVKGPDHITILSVPGMVEKAIAFAKSDKLLHSILRLDIPVQQASSL